MPVALLAGKTFLEVAHPYTEYAGLLLAGLGARVIMVEPPGGALARQRYPYIASASESRRSIPFLARNTGKESVVVDLTTEAGRAELGRLVSAADGFLTTSADPISAHLESIPGVPRVTVTDNDALGVSGIVAFAAGGGMSSCGWPHQPPCNAPGWFVLDAAGIYAAVTLLVALFADQPGAAYEVPLREAANAASTPWTRPLHSYGMVVAGQGKGSARLGAGPYPVLRCADGFIRVLTGTPRQWEAWLNLLGRPEALADEAWNSPQFRAANFDAMVAIAAEIVSTRTMADLFSEGQRLSLTITPVLNSETFLADPHVNARGVFETIDDPDAGEVRILRPAVRMGEGETVTPWTPAPALGTHEPVEPRAARPSPSARPRGLPLEGIRVLDCGVGAVVPEAASFLALMGADVIKIESRKHVDFLRQVGLGGPGDHNNAPSFNQMNLGVKSIALDMTTDAGRDIARQLAARCDVLMENMRGPVIAKWGLEYAAVRDINPGIIYLSSQGLGEGPYGGYQTYGPNLQAFSGVTSLWAHPEDPYPVGATLNHPDHVAGKQFLTAVMAALIRRKETGQGAYLDCAQFEAAAGLVGDAFVQQQLLPGTVGPLGNRSRDMAPHGCYPAAGDDQWVAFAVEDDAQWASFAAVCGEPWTADAALATVAGRLSDANLDERISAWTCQRTAAETEKLLRAAGIPASRLIRGDDLAADTGLHDGGFFACVTHPTSGPRWFTGLPIIDREGNRFPLVRPPLLGEHDDYVLRGVLGLSQQEVSALAACGAIGY